MSQQGEGSVDCPFSGRGDDLINVKFFRGRRDDVITAEEIKAQAHEAIMQHKLNTATVSSTAPISLQRPVLVREFLASL